ncbi:MAG: aldo/keto reductase [Planctomycetaceae bacterium]|jgi:aryl-alcohol dehydrogenase-like predicted oxidoreductase|nr:aldo/keto reductase [Planctomycetaceae bacterium]
MEYRRLGHSGLMVPVLALGTGTFGGVGNYFAGWGNTDEKEAKKLVDICLESGICLFDTADCYSRGRAEEILGDAVAGRRDQVLISAKVTFRIGKGCNDLGSSRFHLIRAVEGSLKRLRTDYIDLLHMHTFDAVTPIEETLETLDGFIKSGKVRYIGCSNFSGWHLMKSLAISDKYGWNRYVTHQAYYSLIGRHYEWELMPLALDQGVGTIVWSPLGWGRLTGKIRRGQPVMETSRTQSEGAMKASPPVDEEYLYRVVETLDKIAAETGKTIPQIAINWLLHRPSVVTVIIGARNERQLRQNIGSIGWNLSQEQIAILDSVSAVDKIYPYWHQTQFHDRNPFPIC